MNDISVIQGQVIFRDQGEIALSAVSVYDMVDGHCGVFYRATLQNYY